MQGKKNIIVSHKKNVVSEFSDVENSVVTTDLHSQSSILLIFLVKTLIG